ncbi:ExbD/TolR family protein [Pajaroellobacter abortibovis]|uniref:Adventurous gliding motility protein AglS n=1 Tax=Pajaroellobacter abortibovis TaxID=1882918 RepID=A0A1L6MVD2_9BACT|nr:biopolymer transporter ExbD [Pajaroellobacter abortibovis]APR99466.1 adventurous gliding motility protein AglS [Pajaroellobacter abortibovis]
MPIQKPGRRLMHHVGLRFVEDKLGGHGSRSVAAGLSLTSMIDFLIVVVVFLLMTFSASGETPIAKNITLPKASNTVDMMDAPIAAVSGESILVDGALAGDIKAIEQNKQVTHIEDLFNALKAKRDLWKQTHPGKDFPGVAILQIDQDVSALIVKSVFQTAATAGYPHVSFMVSGLKN